MHQPIATKAEGQGLQSCMICRLVLQSASVKQLHLNFILLSSGYLHEKRQVRQSASHHKQCQPEGVAIRYQIYTLYMHSGNT